MDLQKLSTYWKICLGISLIAFLVALYASGQFAKPELVMIVMIFAGASILYSTLFFIACRLAAPDLSSFIVDDETKVKGPTVVMETTLLETPDAEINKWVSRYAFARNTFGLAIIPLLLLGGVFLFG